MKKLIALLLCVLMLSGMCTAYAEEFFIISAPTVHVRIEDCDKNLFNGSIDYTADMTALDAALEALKQTGLDVVTSVSPYGGMYISSIGDRKEGDFGGYEGWMYYVNGESPMYNIADCKLEPGQQLLVAYADMDVLLPILTAARDKAGVVTLTVSADVTTYDANWNATVTRQPVEGVTVTVDGEQTVTDASGKVVLSAESSAKESVTVQLQKKKADGLPQVLPLAPDFALDLTAVQYVRPSFVDVAQGLWYTDYVLDLAESGLMQGYPDGTFLPAGKVSRAMVAQVLYRMSGEVPVNYLMPFSDVAEGLWYTEAIRWAASVGVVEGRDDGTFGPNANVTRQDLAVMLARYVEKVAKTELPQDSEAPAFADNADIAPYAAEAVYLLQKAGIVGGTDGKFLPQDTADRAQLCKMIAGLTQ